MQIPAAQKPYKRRFRTFRSISALILREMETSYGRSPGGYLWAILDPVAGIAVLSIIIGFVMRAPPLGSNFPLFYATGLLPFTMYMSLSNQVTSAVTFSQALLAYPAVTFLDALLARFLLNALTQILVMVIVIFGTFKIYDLKLIFDWFAILNSLAMATVLALSVGTLNCYLTARFTIWSKLWAILMRPMFILSGIFFIPENVPTQLLPYLMINPVAHIISEFRKGFYATYEAVHVNSLYVYVIILVVGALGMILLLKNHKDIALR